MNSDMGQNEEAVFWLNICPKAFFEDTRTSKSFAVKHLHLFRHVAFTGYRRLGD
jgi:hypothetical protein